jgi:hypothetical protein
MFGGTLRSAWLLVPCLGSTPNLPSPGPDLVQKSQQGTLIPVTNFFSSSPRAYKGSGFVVRVVKNGVTSTVEGLSFATR